MMMMSGSDENMNVDGNILLLYSAVQLTEVKVHNFFARGWEMFSNEEKLIWAH